VTQDLQPLILHSIGPFGCKFIALMFSILILFHNNTVPVQKVPVYCKLFRVSNSDLIGSGSGHILRQNINMGKHFAAKGSDPDKIARQIMLLRI
jgi:hypothetical protein